MSFFSLKNIFSIFNKPIINNRFFKRTATSFLLTSSLIYLGINSGYINNNANYLSLNSNKYLCNIKTPLECLVPNEDILNKNISTIYYPANNPIEDRYNVKVLKNMKEALFMSVLDGHGGHTLSEFVNNRLANYIDEEFNNLNKNTGSNINDIVINSIKNAFQKVENEFKTVALDLYQNKGQGKMSTVGSCALVTIIYNNTLYVANLGDSKASLFGYDKSAKNYYYIKLMYRHNSELPREKQMLYEKFPNDKDIVVCKRPNGTVCYVKGRLQPTRSFGDFHLKYKEFNENSGNNYKRQIKNFNGPYISSEPEITVYNLEPNDKYLILATDGLGDFVSTNEIIDIIEEKEKKQNKDLVAQDLFDKVMSKAAEESNLTVPQLKSVPLGKRRNLHDDTTIIVLKL